MTENEIKYEDYVREHIENVRRVWELFKNDGGISFSYDDYHYINNLIKVHDASKYSEPEFSGYTQWFYPNDSKDEGVFNGAWRHHYNTNPHHWEHWVVIKHTGMLAMPMPFIHVIEMLCDWGAMSLRFGNSPSEYYDSHKDKMVLHEDTQDIIDTWLPIFDKILKLMQNTEK